MKYRVIFQQVNQVAFEVAASSEAEAGDIAVRKWLREHGHPVELQVKEIKAAAEVKSNAR